MKKIILLLPICFFIFQYKQCFGMESLQPNPHENCQRSHHYERPPQLLPDNISSYNSESLYKHYPLTELSVVNQELTASIALEENNNEQLSYFYQDEISPPTTSQMPDHDYYSEIIRHNRSLRAIQIVANPYYKNYFYCEVRPELIDLPDQLDRKPNKENDSSTINKPCNLEELAEMADQQPKLYTQSYQERPHKEENRKIVSSRKGKRVTPYTKKRYQSKYVINGNISEFNHFDCPLCPISFCAFAALFEHLTSHNTNNNCCPICNQSLSVQRTFCNHILRKHNSITFFMCEICHKKQKTQDDYQQHIKTHG